MLSNKERCDIDTILIVPSEHGKITDEEEIEVGWDALVLSKDVSGTLEVAGSSAVRKGQMNHKAEIAETAAGIKMFNVTKKIKRHNQLCLPFEYLVVFDTGVLMHQSVFEEIAFKIAEWYQHSKGYGRPKSLLFSQTAQMNCVFHLAVMNLLKLLQITFLFKLSYQVRNLRQTCSAFTKCCAFGIRCYRA